jgi:hypothetical protein
MMVPGKTKFTYSQPLYTISGLRSRTSMAARCDSAMVGTVGVGDSSTNTDSTHPPHEPFAALHTREA